MTVKGWMAILGASFIIFLLPPYHRNLIKCHHLLIITGDEEREEMAGGKKIEIVPLWKWLLKN